jgi:hypothetical protein
MYLIIIKTHQLYVHGVDKEGHPLVIYNVRLSKPSERDLDEAVRHLVWWLEWVIRSMREDVVCSDEGGESKVAKRRVSKVMMFTEQLQHYHHHHHHHHHLNGLMVKITVIFNRVEFRQENTDMELIKAATAVLQNNYPEILCRSIVYPTNFIFYALWNVVKFFLDPVTQVLALASVFLHRRH